MKKCIYLSTCDTCRKIIKAAELSQDFEMHDLKKMPLLTSDLEFLRTKVDGYIDLVNKRSRRIKALGLNLGQLSEKELKQYLIAEYTFLKRPVFIINEQVFIGNSKSTVESLMKYLESHG